MINAFKQVSRRCAPSIFLQSVLSLPPGSDTYDISGDDETPLAHPLYSLTLSLPTGTHAFWLQAGSLAEVKHNGARLVEPGDFNQAPTLGLASTVIIAFDDLQYQLSSHSRAMSAVDFPIPSTLFATNTPRQRLLLTLYASPMHPLCESQSRSTPYGTNLPPPAHTQRLVGVV